MSVKLERNIQTIVDESTHKALRDYAYEVGLPLRDLLRSILTSYADSIRKSRDAGNVTNA